MKMDDMVIVSVDDHITEPPTVFDNQLSGEDYATAPKLKLAPDGANFWEYQGKRMRNVALNSVTGRVREEYGFEPTNLDQLRPGCYDVHARIGDMNVNGCAASLNFPSVAGIDGGLFIRAEDKRQALTHMRAYNDWHVDEWCGAYPGRFIPLGVLPLWDMDLTAKEVHRLADRPASLSRLLEEAAAAGMEQAIVVTATPEPGGPHELEPPRVDPRGRVGEWLSGEEAAAVRDAVRYAQAHFHTVFVIRPVHNPIAPLDVQGADDRASDRHCTLQDLLERGYDDAHRLFIEPALGAAGERVPGATW